MSKEFVVYIKPMIGPEGVLIKGPNGEDIRLMPDRFKPNAAAAPVLVKIKSLDKVNDIFIDEDNKKYSRADGKNDNNTFFYDVDGNQSSILAGKWWGDQFDQFYRQDGRTYMRKEDLQQIEGGGGRLRRSNSKSRKFYKKSTKRSASRKYRR